MDKLFAFQWHITDLCNLRCRHCYQERFDAARDIPIEQWNAIIRNIIETLRAQGYSALDINLTGGEPLISPILYPLLSILEREVFVNEVSIITNGLKLKTHSNHLSRFKKLAEIRVSLEGGTAQTNDAIRGEGNFERVVNNLKAQHFFITLMFTLSQLNYRELDEMIKLATNLQVGGVILERFIPMGAGNAMRESVLDDAGWQKILTAMAALAECDADELIPYKGFYIDLKNDNFMGAPCNLGDEAMALMPNGDVYPCRRLPIPLGNLCGESFADILEKLRAFRFQFRKERLGGLCRNCPEAGCIGCRALSYAMSGDLFAAEPQCCIDLPRLFSP